MLSRLMVYAGNSMHRDDFLNDATRKHELDEVQSTIEHLGIPGIRLMMRMEMACALSYEGPLESLKILRAELRDRFVQSRIDSGNIFRGAVDTSDKRDDPHTTID